MSSKIKGLRRVGIVGLSTVVAASMMSLSAVSAQADWAAGTAGEIGLVDTDTTVIGNGTDGATLIKPGVSGQALGDIRLLIPNKFANGDTIDLTIFDRTATNSSNGAINTDTAHKLGFSGAPTVTVNPTPVDQTTSIGPSSADIQNTERTDAAGDPDPVVTPGQATTPPAFTTSLVQSSRANGLANDIIRLKVNAVASAGRDTDEWIVTVKGIVADLGTAVSPGELRVVPFAYNGAPSTTFTNQSPLFGGNLANGQAVVPVTVPATTVPPTIVTYTVPAYVAPVDFSVGAPNNIVADGTSQSVGDVTIAETNNYSLQTGTYTVTVVGADTLTGPVVVTATGLAAGESVTTPATITGNALSFDVVAASNTSKISIKLSGLMLTDATAGPITYTLSGGSINGSVNSFLVEAGTSGVIGTPPNGVAADSAFGGSVNQNDIVAPPLVPVNAISTPLAFRIGGNDRYETAAKIAATNGASDNVILASGQDFPDALSSGYLANQVGGASILLTKQGSLPAVTADAMRLNGNRTVYLIGGTGAISASVEAQLRATPQYYADGEITVGQGRLQVIRLGGANRFVTNKIVNQRAAALSVNATAVGRTQITFGQSSKLTALVATGNDFADALAAGPATTGRNGYGNLPLILTRPTTLDPNASSQLNTLGIQQAVILGGTGAVSAGVEASILGKGVAIHRIGGANRYETSAMIADFETAREPVAATATTPAMAGGLFFDPATTTNQRAYLARGDDFADALAGAPLAGGSGSPILLTAPATLSPATSTWLTGHAARYSSVVAFGLGGAVSNSVLAAANAAISAK